MSFLARSSARQAGTGLLLGELLQHFGNRSMQKDHEGSMCEEEPNMARTSNLDKMSYRELTEMETRIGRLIVEQRDAERAALKDKVTALAREHGFDIRELVGRGKGRSGSVAVKYRDPE